MSKRLFSLKQINPMRMANIKRRKKVKINDVVYESMTHASAKLGKSIAYVNTRYRNFDRKMPDGSLIERVYE